MNHRWLLFGNHTLVVLDCFQQVAHLAVSTALCIEDSAVGNVVNGVLIWKILAFKFRLEVERKSGPGMGSNFPAMYLDASGQAVGSGGVADRCVGQAEGQKIED